MPYQGAGQGKRQNKWLLSLFTIYSIYYLLFTLFTYLLNILNRIFIVEKPNAVWVSDITYIWTFEGWLYLAAILDLFSRGIVGLAMDKTIADTLTLSALRQAIVWRSPPKGPVYHSDRGVQYAANDFKALLAQHEFVGSMSKKRRLLG